MTVRTGFIARGFIPFGTLTVSWGYGNYGTEPIPTPTPQPVEVLIGTAIPGVKASGSRAPGFGAPRKKPQAVAMQSVYVPGTRKAGMRLKATTKK